MDGIILVDKPAGWTSHDAAAYVKKTLGAKKAGHTGTLDPAATGLVVVLVGKATRLARYFEQDEKTYLAVLLLGAETDTLDTEGEVTRRCPVPELTAEAVVSVLDRFRGEITQIPPMYSAVKVGGSPLYRHARAGREVERQARTVTIRDIRLTGLSDDRVSFTVDCSKGTYIRTLCKDIAEALGSCGHLETLRRTGAGGFKVEDAVELAARPAAEELTAAMAGPDSMLGWLPKTVLKPGLEGGILNGKRPAPDELDGLERALEPGMKTRLMSSDGRLLAVAGVEAGDAPGGVIIKLEVVLS